MPSDIALDFGKDAKDCLEKALAKVKRSGEATSVLRLVIDEAPDFMDDLAQRLIERAAVIVGDRDCFRMTDDDLVVHIPALPHGTLAEMQAEYGSIVKIESDTSTTEAVTLRLATVLKSTETSGIDGATYERRITKLRTGGKILGFSHRKWLVANQDNEKAIPDANVRAALKALLGKVYIDFSGTIVVHEDGHRCIPCALNGGRRWHGRWHHLADHFHSNGRVAVSASS